MPTSGPFLTANSYVGLGVETTRGTAVTPTWWLPYDGPQWTPNIKDLDDDGMRGSPVKTYDWIPGVRSDEFEFKGKARLDTFPALIRAALGSTDTVTGTSAPYTHTIGLLNNQTGSQPPSYTIVDFDGWQARQITGAQLVSLEIQFTAEGAVTYTAKFIGNPATNVAAPTSAFTSELMVPAWNNTVTIEGSTASTLIEGSITINRASEPIFTGGQQGPYVVFAQEAEITGKLMVLALSTDAVLSNALTRAQALLKFVLTDPVSSHSLTLQMTTAQLRHPKVERGKAYVQVSADILAVPNSTDAVSGGVSGLKTITMNALSTAF